MRGLLLFFVSVAAFSGCDPDFVAPSKIAEVTGEVVLDGNPVNGAKVVFVPMNVSDGGRTIPFAYGVTDAKGNFELKMADDKKGAFVGKYLVVISKRTGGPDLNSVTLPLPGGTGDLEGQDELESRTTGLSPESRAKLLAAIFSTSRGEMNFQASPQQPSNEQIPILYNLESTLVREVRSGGGISRPKFELWSVDPLLRDLK